MAKKKLVTDSEIEESRQSESIYESNSGKKKIAVNRDKKKQNMKSGNKSSKNSAKKNNKNKTSNTKNKNKNRNNNSNKKSNKDDSEDENRDLDDKILPGQKYPTPPKGDPVRAFYESMLKQKPDSLMALKHCLEFGCLTRHEAESAIKRLNKIKK